MIRWIPAAAVIVFVFVFVAVCTPAQDLYDVGTIRTIEVTVPSNWRTIMATNYTTRTYIKADVKVDGVTYKDCGVRHRGFSTYRSLPSSKTDKRPWKISADEYVNGQRIQGYRTLNINNNVWDPSFMREVVGYEFMRQYVPCPKCCFVRLKVNGEDIGLFVNTQQINKDFLKEWFRDDEGNRYRGERTGSSSFNDTALTWLGTSQSRYQSAYELKTENGPPAWAELIQAIDKLNNTPVAQRPTELPKVIDVDDALRFLAAGNITAWLDSYLGRVCHNFYIYADPFHGRLQFQPWDMNNGFGGLTDGLGTNGVAQLDPFRYETSTSTPRPLLGKIVQIPAWRARYLAHYRHMLEAFDWTLIGARINQLRTFIRPELNNDPKRIYTMAQFDQNLTQAVNVGFVTVVGLQPFFVDRRAYLNGHADITKIAPTLANLSHTPTAPGPQDPVGVRVDVSGVTATSVKIYHRVRGPYTEAPMFDDGQHNDGAANDGTYGAAIPAGSPLALVEYYVSAESNLSNGGAMAFEPPTAGFKPITYRVAGLPSAGNIVISEFIAKNDTGVRDENGDRDDWIELTNTSGQPVSVSGMYLTDNARNPNKWQIPAGYTLQPGQTLHVWADDEGTQGPLHASFKLSAGGEEVALFDTDGKTNLDWIGFGPQIGDVSTGRPFGFSGVTVTYPVATPMQANRPEPCGHLGYDGIGGTAQFALTGQGTPTIGTTITYAVSQAPPSTPGLLALSIAPSAASVGPLGSLLVNLTGAAPLGIATNGAGAASRQLPIPNAPALAGSTFYLQAFAYDGTNGGFSNAVATRVCP